LKAGTHGLAHIGICGSKYSQHGALCWKPNECRHLRGFQHKQRCLHRLHDLTLPSVQHHLLFCSRRSVSRVKIPPTAVDVSGDLDVRSVLLDPKGAIVGSFLLISCLTIVIVVSFLHVDVWMITLPFAGAKFIFDIAWDHYRYVHKTSTFHQLRESLMKTWQESGTNIVLRQLRQHRTIPIVESARLEAEITSPSKITSETTAIDSPSSIQVVNNHSILNAQEKDQPVLSDSPQQSQGNLAAFPIVSR
jgi:hypothetical protein